MYQFQFENVADTLTGQKAVKVYPHPVGTASCPICGRQHTEYAVRRINAAVALPTVEIRPTVEVRTGRFDATFEIFSNGWRFVGGGFATSDEAWHYARVHVIEDIMEHQGKIFLGE